MDYHERMKEMPQQNDDQLMELAVVSPFDEWVRLPCGTRVNLHYVAVARYHDDSGQMALQFQIADGTGRGEMWLEPDDSAWLGAFLDEMMPERNKA